MQGCSNTGPLPQSWPRCPICPAAWSRPLGACPWRSGAWPEEAGRHGRVCGHHAAAGMRGSGPRVPAVHPTEQPQSESVGRREEPRRAGVLGGYTGRVRGVSPVLCRMLPGTALRFRCPSPLSADGEGRCGGLAYLRGWAGGAAALCAPALGRAQPLVRGSVEATLPQRGRNERRPCARPGLYPAVEPRGGGRPSLGAAAQPRWASCTWGPCGSRRPLSAAGAARVWWLQPAGHAGPTNGGPFCFGDSRWNIVVREGRRMSRSLL